MMPNNRRLNTKFYAAPAALCMAVTTGLNRFLSLVLQWLVRLYQLTLSPFIGNQCRFHPTCSHYAMESLQRHGPWRGSWLAATRLGRCHPFAEGGVDPVPKSGSENDLPHAQTQLNRQLQPHVEETL